MRRVYVSSTYEDLKDARARVIRAIERHPDFRPVAMENYAAHPKPPLETCLADVRACDVYLGLLGSRSGYVPPNQTKSITFLEFEAARAAGKPCLFFLFPTTAELTSDAGIEEFRAIAKRDYTCVLVVDATQLGELVLQSLIKLGSTRAYSERQHLLPYVCDRVQQRQGLQRKLQRRTGCTTPFAIVHGMPEQMPDRFMRWLQEELFAELAVLPEAVELAPAWPRRTRTEAEFIEVLTQNLAAAAQLQLSDATQLRQMLARRPVPWYVSMALPLDTWQQSDSARLMTLHEYFVELGAEPGAAGGPAAVLLWVMYKTPEPRRLFGFKRRNTSELANERMQAVLQAAESSGKFTVLEELGDLYVDDVREWTQRRDVARHTRERDLIHEVDAIFVRPSLPMKPVAAALKAILDRP